MLTRYTCVLSFLIAAASVSGPACAQRAASFAESEKAGINMADLDAAYPPALSGGKVRGVFDGKSDDFIEAYHKMLGELGTYLRKNGFEWPAPTKEMHRIYFNESGGIDYFLYRIRGDKCSAVRKEQYQSMLDKFVAGYRFPLPAGTKFSQCGSARFEPAEK